MTNQDVQNYKNFVNELKQYSKEKQVSTGVLFDMSHLLPIGIKYKDNLECFTEIYRFHYTKLRGHRPKKEQ